MLNTQLFFFSPLKSSYFPHIYTRSSFSFWIENLNDEMIMKNQDVYGEGSDVCWTIVKCQFLGLLFIKKGQLRFNFAAKTF